jgi:4'-phosphopantetheinyl transferase
MHTSEGSRQTKGISVARIQVPEREVSTDASLRQILSAEELGRIDRCASPLRRRQAAVAYATRRHILGEILSLDPQAVPPASRSDSALCSLRGLPFYESLAHSGRWIFYAVSLGRHLGVDVERVSDEIDVERLAKRFLAPSEASSLALLSTEERREAFFRLWTRKEAYLKARGGGVPSLLRSVTVSAGVEPRLLSDRKDEAAPRGWTLRDLDGPEGYAAALAVEGDAGEIRTFECPFTGELGDAA